MSSENKSQTRFWTAIIIWACTLLVITFATRSLVSTLIDINPGRLQGSTMDAVACFVYFFIAFFVALNIFDIWKIASRITFELIQALIQAEDGIQKNIFRVIFSDEETADPEEEDMKYNPGNLHKSRIALIIKKNGNHLADPAGCDSAGPGSRDCLSVYLLIITSRIDCA